MPPKKRARVSQASTPQPKASVEATSPDAQNERSNLLTDPWTDDEESQLFKTLIKYKPTGIHRHFRMMAIAKDFQSHGYTAPNIEHTRPSGIWDKLESLYDLEVLNERENHHMGISNTPSEEAQSAEEQAAIEEETEEGEDNPWRRRDFGLPDEDFEELAFAKRLDSDRESSPEEIEGLSRTRNVIGDEEMRERREEYDKENAGSVRGKGRKATAARATRARGARGSTRSTPATVDDSEEGGEEEGTSTVDDSPQGKGSKKGVSRGASIRRGRRR